MMPSNSTCQGSGPPPAQWTCCENVMLKIWNTEDNAVQQHLPALRAAACVGFA